MANTVPQPCEIIEVTLDLGLGPREARGADNQAHALGQAQAGDNFFQALAVAGGIDLAADPATVAAVGHKHSVTACKA